MRPATLPISTFAIVIAAAWFVASPALIEITHGSAPAPAAAACAPSPARDALDVVGPMTGQSPVWLVDGSAGRWTHATHPVKTLWIVDQPGVRLQIAGRRLDGVGIAGFRRGSGPVASTLLVEDSARASVIPGGATPDLMRQYAFITSYVLYPSPGCWEFTVAVGEESFRIVHRIGS